MMMTIMCTGNYFINLSMVFLASPDSAKWEIIRWIISPMVKSYLLLISFKFFWFFGVVRNDRKTCFLLILLQQFYKWWLDYFFTIFKYDGEIGTIPLSNIRYSPLAKDFMLNLISYVKFSHLFKQFIYGILGITRVSKVSNHPMDNIPYAHVILALNRLQMLLILRGSTKW